MEGWFQSVKEKASRQKATIVFPEAQDERILQAVSQLQKEGVVSPLLIGNEASVQAAAEKSGIDLGGIQVYDPATYDDMDRLVEAFVERRKGKATEAQARDILTNVNYFGTMLVHLGIADGLVSGATHSTADTVRPALQIIKTKPGVKKTSGVFFMGKGTNTYVFADCAINIAPDAADLAEIARESAQTAELFGVDPRVAMLSFSTKGSASSEETERVAEAVRIVHEQAPELVVDGEFQFDAAVVPAVAQKKAPDSPIQGNATVFVFPSLEAGNIGYKIAQRFGEYSAVGPILQGLAKPVNDLSRGCSAEDVYRLALLTAVQSSQND
ncbi:phosphate acetyltransferase [Bacillaceae bacterium SIJ1]|uniref:phosphate acetyltransferase n=1 Tax=Litoribacterium kuwaitense TaxID=1398745 RepID=UPI0013ECF70A|nr:phosphate acetyltransferase [Litoribacterium kuwaitense]NGP44696.1 phosphate acetyltransferase [Litoribacterium kuwaitense]